MFLSIELYDTRRSLRHKTRRHIRPRDRPESVDKIPVTLQGSTVRYNIFLGNTLQVLYSLYKISRISLFLVYRLLLYRS
jgi:hypothetical protein